MWLFKHFFLDYIDNLDVVEVIFELFYNDNREIHGIYLSRLSIIIGSQ